MFPCAWSCLTSCQAVWLAPEAVAVAMERKELLRYQEVLSQPKEGARLPGILGPAQSCESQNESWVFLDGHGRMFTSSVTHVLPARYQVTFYSFLKCHQPSQWNRKAEIQAGKPKEIDSPCAQEKVRSKDQALTERNMLLKLKGSANLSLVKELPNSCCVLEPLPWGSAWLVVTCPFLFLPKHTFGLLVPASHSVRCGHVTESHPHRHHLQAQHPPCDLSFLSCVWWIDATARAV